MPAEKKEYRYVGNHAVELEVGDTRPQVGFGDFIELSTDDIKVDSVKDLIAQGVLINTNKLPEAKAADIAALEESTTESKGGK